MTDRWWRDPDAMWRPEPLGNEPVCGYTLDGKTCEKRGPHRCAPRADRPVKFFDELLVHTKGKWRRQRFRLTGWQEWEIVRPLFGEVVWSDEHDRYVRRYAVFYIVVARKNGKSELVAAIALYLLVGDDEPGSEVYVGAKDTKQAGKVFEPSVNMRKLSPVLSKRLGYNKNNRRIFDEQTNSFYETITADALGELGHNPHGFLLDEMLSQLDGSLWESGRTSEGTRVQPMFGAISTETNDASSWAANQIDEALKVQADPSRAPHVFAYVRKLPMDDQELEELHRQFEGHPDLPKSCDPFDEDNWAWPNPALDDFKSREAMRRQALEAKNEPAKENSFRQYQTNQRVQQTTRYIPMHLWDANVGEVAANPEWVVDRLQGSKCWGGLDLSSKLDLTAWCLRFDDRWLWWRFWTPEATLPVLDRATGGQASVWGRDGWLTVTEGDVIDYQTIYDDLETDAHRFAVVDVTYDRWSGEPVRQEVQSRTGWTMYESQTTYTAMTSPMSEFMRGLKAGEYKHGGNPVARWMADCLEAKHPTDDASRVRPVKPDRQKEDARIDGMVAAFLAEDGAIRSQSTEETSYRTAGF